VSRREQATDDATPIKSPTVFAVMSIVLLSFGVILTIPAFIGVLGKSYGIPAASLGRLASAEFFVCIAGTYLTNGRSIAQLALWVPILCAATVAVHVAGMLLVTHVPLIFFHPLAAFAAGVSYGYVLKVIDASGRQERNFGIFLALFNVTMLLEFQIIAYATSRYSGAAVFMVYAVATAVATTIAVLVRKGVTRSVVAVSTTASMALPAGDAVGSWPRPSIIVSVVALAAAYVGYGIIWPFLQLIGVARGFLTQAVANSLSAYAISAIGGALLAAALPVKYSRALVLPCALIALLLSIVLLFGTSTYLPFLAGCCVFGMYWSFYCATYVGLIARADTTGRGIVLCGVAPSVGTVVGSFFGGMLMHETGGWLQAGTAIAVCVGSLTCTLVTLARITRSVELGVETPVGLSS
jgi:hypothetical protein